MTKNNSWILKHFTVYKDSDQIMQLFITGRARVVTDGSFFPKITTAIGSAYWRAETIDGQVLFIGSCRTTGSTSNVYRS